MTGYGFDDLDYDDEENNEVLAGPSNRDRGGRLPGQQPVDRDRAATTGVKRPSVNHHYGPGLSLTNEEFFESLEASCRTSWTRQWRRTSCSRTRQS